MIFRLWKLLKFSPMGHCNFYFWGCLSKVTRLLLFMIIFKANTVAYKMKRLRSCFRYNAPITFKNAKKWPAYTCMQVCPDILACKLIRGATQSGVSGYVVLTTAIWLQNLSEIHLKKNQIRFEARSREKWIKKLNILFSPFCPFINFVLLIDVN